MPAAAPQNTRARQRRRPPPTPRRVEPTAPPARTRAKQLRSKPATPPRSWTGVRPVTEKFTPTRPPSKTQLRSARAQGRGYASQGRAVEKAAQNQRQIAKLRGDVVKMLARRAQPTDRQLRQGRAQLRHYRTQAGAVRRQAMVDELLGPITGPGVTIKPKGEILHRKTVEKVQRELAPLVRGREYTSQALDVAERSRPPREVAGEELAKLIKPTRGVYSKQDLGKLTGLVQLYGATAGKEAFAQQRAETDAQSKARALKLLDNLLRGQYASAGAAKALVQGKGAAGAAKAAYRGGVQLKDRTSYSDVLTEAGWKPKSGLGRFAKGAVAFTGDVGLDPTTYIGLGGASLGTKAALKGARKAARVERKLTRAEALSQGATRRQARQIGRAEGRQAFAQTYQKGLKQAEGEARGLDVRFAGRSVPGVTRATAKGRKVASKLVPKSSKPLRQSVRQSASDLNATVRPPGLTPDEFTQRLAIERGMRATETRLRRRAAARAANFHILASPEEGALLRRAIESGDDSILANAPPIKLPRIPFAGRPAGRKRLVALASDPDRLLKLKQIAGNDWDQLRTMLIDTGTPVGWVGAKPPVRVPDVTADVPAAQKAASQATQTAKRAEREAERQRYPGPRPGKITPAEKTRAERLAKSARDRQSAAQSAVERAKRMAEKAPGPEVKARITRTGRAARALAAKAKGEAEHWEAVAARPLRPARPLVGPEGKVIQAAAPQRAALPLARRGARAARRDLKATIIEARLQRAAQRDALKRKAAREAEAQGYWPRIPKTQIEEKGRHLTLEDIVDVGGGRGSTRASSTMRRKETRKIEDLEQGSAADQRYAERQSHELGLVSQAYGEGMARAIARGEATQALRAAGRALVPGEKVAIDETIGEAMYRYENGKLRRVDTSRESGLDEVRAVETGRAADGDYVVLKRQMADPIIEVVASPSSHAGRSWERFIGAWRKIALGTPAYLGRNAASDLFAAYGAQNPARLAQNYYRGQRTLNELARAERSYRAFEGEMERLGKGTSTTINGRPMLYRDLALEAEAAGAIRSGRVQEILEQRQAGKGGRLEVPKGTGAWQKTVQRVEDSARMATYIGFRERGFSPEQAAQYVGKIHFDYGQLTRLEKGMRKAAPFYTFTARNIPRQAQLAATRPGKLAAYEKVRQTGERANVGDPDNQVQGDLDALFKAGLDPYESRQIGIPVTLPKILGGGHATVSWGLPITDLNDVVPADLSDPKSWIGLPVASVTRRGLELLGPFKAIPELILNYSVFYREAIEDPNTPLTPVPEPVGKVADLSPYLRKQAGMRKIKDKKTGEMIWAWPKQVDYGVRNALPGGFGAVWRNTYDRTNARGFNPRTELLGSLTGIRAKPIDPVQNELNRLYSQQEKLKRAEAIDNQAGMNLYTNPSKLYRQRSQALRDIGRRIDQLNRSQYVFYKGRPNVKRPAPER